MRLVIIGIILVCLIALAATIGTIVIGSRSFEGLVVDKPYETGLAWDAERKKCDRLGWKAAPSQSSFPVGRNVIDILVTTRDGALLSGATVTVLVTRPATRVYDRVSRAIRETSGQYRTSIELPVFGAWDLRTTVARDGDLCVFNQRIYAEKSPGVR